jgi:hypothetical protein
MSLASQQAGRQCVGAARAENGDLTLVQANDRFALVCDGTPRTATRPIAAKASWS